LRSSRVSREEEASLVGEDMRSRAEKKRGKRKEGKGGKGGGGRRRGAGSLIEKGGMNEGEEASCLSETGGERLIIGPFSSLKG
jgi:hypothetical protein